LRAAAPVVAGIRDQALSVGYIRNLAGWLGMDPSEVQRAVAPARTSLRTAQPPSEPPSGPSLTQLPTDPATRLERDALMAILQYPKEIGAELMQRATRAAFSDHTLSVVRDAIAGSLERLETPQWLEGVAAEVPPSFSTLVNQLGVAPIPERADRIGAYARSVVVDLIDRDLLRRKRDLLGSMQRMDATADPERYSQVQRDLVSIETERRALRDE